MGGSAGGARHRARLLRPGAQRHWGRLRVSGMNAEGPTEPGLHAWRGDASLSFLSRAHLRITSSPTTPPAPGVQGTLVVGARGSQGTAGCRRPGGGQPGAAGAGDAPPAGRGAGAHQAAPPQRAGLHGLLLAAALPADRWVAGWLGRPPWRSGGLRSPASSCGPFLGLQPSCTHPLRPQSTVRAARCTTCCRAPAGMPRWRQS